MVNRIAVLVSMILCSVAWGQTQSAPSGSQSMPGMDMSGKSGHDMSTMQGKDMPMG